MDTSLFEKYGGFSTVSKIVLTLYDRVLDDDDIGPFFDSVNLPAIIDHQTKFVSSLMGGPASFSDDHIERAHRHMDIHPHHFDRLKELVANVLVEFQVEPADIEVIVGAFEKRRTILIEKPNVH